MNCELLNDNDLYQGNSKSNGSEDNKQKHAGYIDLEQLYYHNYYY